MVLEAVTGTLVNFLFQQIVDSAKSADTKKSIDQALNRSTARALQSFAREHPDLSNSLFDQTFLQKHAGAEIAKLLTRDKKPDLDCIVQAYNLYFPTVEPKLDSALADFIRMLEQEMKNEDELGQLISNRQIDKISTDMVTTEVFKEEVDRLFSTFKGVSGEGNLVGIDSERKLLGSNLSDSELRGVFGREREIEKVIQTLRDKFAVTLYGMSGIGKTSIVNEVRLSSDYIDGGYISLRIYQDTSLGDLYRQLAPALGCRDENPAIPIKLFGKYHFAELIKFVQKGKTCLIHLTYAQNLFNDKGFKDSGIREFFLTLAKHAPQVKCIFESREFPPNNIFNSGLHGSLKIQGLDLTSMHKYFQQPQGDTPEKEWHLSDGEAMTIYRRLGGNDNAGNMAHPFGMFLLSTVANCHNETPIQVLERHDEVLSDELEEALFRDLYENALDPAEKRILRICALYREWIPDEHVESLEIACGKEGAFGYILRRCLLTPDEREERYFLHSLIADFVHRRIDHASEEHLENHECVGEAWFLPLKVTKRSNLRTIKAASEAAYHFIHAECFERLKELIDRRLLSDLVPYLESFSAKLHRERRVGDNRHVLEVLVAIDPDNDKGHRFLGEILEKQHGEGDLEALSHYEKAHVLNPSFPPYLANIGRNLLAQKKPQEFISLVDEIPPKIKKLVLNDYNHAIFARCLSATNRESEASEYRNRLISRGSKHITFYTDEALYLCKKEKYVKALTLLDKAESLNIYDPILKNIRAFILDKKGDNIGASNIRQDQIKSKSINVDIYIDEAFYLIKLNKIEEALSLIEKAIRRIGADDSLLSTKANLLEISGNVSAASKIRNKRIKENSRHLNFYRDEARYLYTNGHLVEALNILDLAAPLDESDERTVALRANILEQMGKTDEALLILKHAKDKCISNDFTLSIEGKLLEKVGRGEEASSIRKSLIESGTRDPVIYNDEASYLLGKGHKKRAIEIIEKAESLTVSNSYLSAVKAKILESMGLGKAASDLRQRLICEKTENPAIYCDEAIYLSSKLQQSDDALTLLDLVEKLGLANDYSRAVKSQILDSTGNTEQASKLREISIEEGSVNPIFHNDKAVRLRNQKKYDLALMVLDNAEKLGAVNDYSVAIRASILHEIGQGQSASVLRQRHIANGARHPALFNDEAVYQRNQGNIKKALEIVKKCEALDLMDHKLRSTKKSIVGKLPET